MTTYLNISKCKVNSEIVKSILRADFDVKILLPDVKAQISKEIEEVFD